jgi:hypothetical protein
MQNVAAARALQAHQHSPATTGSNAADDAVYGTTTFSDMSPAEFRTTRLTFKQVRRHVFYRMISVVFFKS